MIATLYRRACARPSDINEHLPTLYAEVLDHDAQVVIELGTRGGNSTVAFLAALEATGGHLWSVDISPTPLQVDTDRWTFIQGDDLQVAHRTPEVCDVVFIDTSHAYDHTLAELSLYAPKVRPGGVVLLHDTNLEAPQLVGPQPPFPVRLAVSEFCEARGWEWEEHMNNNGLGIVRVP